MLQQARRWKTTWTRANSKGTLKFFGDSTIQLEQRRRKDAAVGHLELCTVGTIMCDPMSLTCAQLLSDGLERSNWNPAATTGQNCSAIFMFVFVVAGECRGHSLRCEISEGSSVMEVERRPTSRSPGVCLLQRSKDSSWHLETDSQSRLTDTWQLLHAVNWSRCASCLQARRIADTHVQREIELMRVQ